MTWPASDGSTVLTTFDHDAFGWARDNLGSAVFPLRFPGPYADESDRREVPGRRHVELR